MPPRIDSIFFTPRRAFYAGVMPLLVLVPYLAYRLSGLSPFETFWEFSTHRYFSALNFFASENQHIWIVQGIPMALLQNGLMGLLIEFDPSDLGTPAQIEWFSQASLLLAYLLIGLGLAGIFLNRHLLLIDAFAIMVATLALFPLTRWYNYFFAPDYWIFEIPFAIISAAWAINSLRNLRGDSNLPSSWWVALSGIWIAACFAQKPSLAGLGTLPILLQLTIPRGRFFEKLWRLALIPPVFFAAHSAMMLAISRFDISTAQSFIRNYWHWLIEDPGSGTSHVSISALIDIAGFLWVPIALGVIAVILCVAVGLLSGDRRKVVITGILAGLLLLGHSFVIKARPSGTSVIDLAICGLFLIPIALALVGDAPRVQMRCYGVAAAVILVAMVLPKPVLWPPAQGIGNGIGPRIAAVSAYTRRIARPVVVVVHDNRAHPLTIEALALYTGQFDLMPWEAAPGPASVPTMPAANSLRQQIFPNTVLVSSPTGHAKFLRSAIKAGSVVIWGSAPAVPTADSFFSDLRVFHANPNAVISKFSMAEGDVYVTYVAYLKNPAGDADRAATFLHPPHPAISSMPPLLKEFLAH